MLNFNAKIKNRYKLYKYMIDKYVKYDITKS